MLQNLVKLDRGELPPTDEHFNTTVETAKKHGSQAIDKVKEEHESAQKRVDNSRASVIKMRNQLQAISNTTKSVMNTGNDVFMKNNR